MARRLRSSNEDRERLLQQSLEASEAERRRIAADLHDGVVQDLVGVSYTLAALSDAAAADGSTEQARRLEAAAGETRRSVRSLRSLLVEIYPPNLADAGLDAALADLAASTNRNGTSIEVSVDPTVQLSDDEQEVVYRVAREALQNVAKHARAQRVTVSLDPLDDGAELVVADDGQGFDPSTVEEGHFGLRLLADLVRQHGDDLHIRSGDDGTTVRLVVRP
jgi:signal transduction histidine kinase